MNYAAIEQGRPWPLGATLIDGGVNFAVFSNHATALELCLFDPHGRNEIARLTLPHYTDGVWHGFLPGAGTGLVYGLRAHGSVDAARGQRFNPAKLLLDPYARRLTGNFRWNESHFGDIHNPADRHSRRDNAADMLKAVVAVEDFDWRGDAPPAIALEDTVLYETHVKGFTWAHPDIAPTARGRFAGMASLPTIAHLKRLGITAVNLLPVQQHLTEYALARRGVANYWGYNTLAFFVPDARYAMHDPLREFKAMVRELHAAGIEVILDVVFNHTAEGAESGPTLCWRGLDNGSWYRLQPSDPRKYENYSGTGNSLDLSQPRVMQFVLDALRYWVSEMHVDGFRFDLATSLARGPRGFDPHHAFLQAVQQDPILTRVKRIAEPWDAGLGGYQLGGFPPGWMEWNDRYRDAMRGFWINKAADCGEIASRLSGSSDLFAHGGRSALASINYVTAHDGFTLRDLLSYDHKHNESNGEDNRDGSDHNLSWNCGAEGETDLLVVNTLRQRLQQALLASLLLSRGVPMLLGGDEIGRTQSGNNNAYAHDDELSWYDWANADTALLDFTSGLIALRRSLPHIRDRHWLTGVADADGCRDVVWLDRHGLEMQAGAWRDVERFVFGMLLGGGAPGKTKAAPLLLLFNAERKDCLFRLPIGQWRLRFDSALTAPFAVDGTLIDKALSLKARGMVALEAISP